VQHHLDTVERRADRGQVADIRLVTGHSRNGPPIEGNQLIAVFEGPAHHTADEPAHSGYQHPCPAHKKPRLQLVAVVAVEAAVTLRGSSDPCKRSPPCERSACPAGRACGQSDLEAEQATGDLPVEQRCLCGWRNTDLSRQPLVAREDERLPAGTP